MKTKTILLILAILVSSCTSTPLATQTPAPTLKPTSTLPPSTSTPKPTSTPVKTATATPEKLSESIMDCKDTKDKIGQFVTCKIERAYCTFSPSTNGDPTFCNDEPYPNQNFALLVWGQDWSDYDGKCIIISGVVGSYNGIPEIVTKNRARVSECP